MQQDTITWFVCPQCGVELGGDPKAFFGPAEAVCANCTGQFKTGLTEWAKLSASQRSLRVIRHLVNPFHSKNVISFVLYPVIGTGIFTIPWLILAFTILHPNYTQTNAVAIACTVIGFVLYLAFIAWILLKGIAASQTYTRTKTPLVWGKKKN